MAGLGFLLANHHHHGTFLYAIFEINLHTQQPFTMTILRVFLRFLLISLLSMAGALEYLLLGSWRSSHQRRKFQAHWLRRYTHGVSTILNIHIHVTGPLPQTPFIVSNHLSYLDIFILGSLRPLFFLAKWDVQNWAWGSTLAACAGTLYIRRQTRSDLPRVKKEILSVVPSGFPIILFLEGTTSDGSSILPFSSALLQPAVDHQWPVTPCHLSYQINTTPNPPSVVWVDEKPFLLHLISLMKYPSINAYVRFGSPLQSDNRKDLAQQLHAQVTSLGNQQLPLVS